MVEDGAGVDREDHNRKWQKQGQRQRHSLEPVTDLQTPPALPISHFKQIFLRPAVFCLRSELGNAWQRSRGRIAGSRFYLDTYTYFSSSLALAIPLEGVPEDNNCAATAAVTLAGY
ncbi:hypothetical protein SUGI_0795430 [Cryptomeria japonica]|nr:hypothetical protein SUGI_0795430 [Cryptomeria japonica]